MPRPPPTNPKANMTHPLNGKHIVLGITGSIAAYKACHIIRLLVKQGAEVQVVITSAGREFITPVTLSTLSGKPVISEFFGRNDGTWHSHVDLGLWADAMLIAPATASTIGKMANGIADNMLVTTYLSAKAPVFVAPAMDLDMYAHPSTQRNLDTLRACGNRIIEPGTGFLASHLVGKGRMEEPEHIVQALEEHFASTEGNMRGRTVLITAGPTCEQIDPVRFIGNYSSGKMGFALADECASRGAKVLLVAGPVQAETRYPVERHDVESASDMYDAVIRLFPQADAAILSAAVADYTPAHPAKQKIKRERTGGFDLELKPTRDIAAALGRLKEGQFPQKVLAGFALETQDEMLNAREKLKRKNFDFIVLNSLRDEGAGFRVDTNKIAIVTPDYVTPYPLKTKTEVAADIVDHLMRTLDAHQAAENEEEGKEEK